MLLQVQEYSILYDKNDQYFDYKDGRYYEKKYIYGISQNPDTKDYIMVLEDLYCEECGEYYTDIKHKWCKPCQLNLKKYSISGNQEIDDLIQEIQLNVNKYKDIILEWIPYNQFNNIKKICKNRVAITYSAIWKNCPYYYYNENNKKWKVLDKKVALSCLYNSQNITDEFLNEVCF